MILLRRLKGEPLLLNPDLIERVEAVPDTIVTLVDGSRILVVDTPDEVIEQVVHFRAAVLCAADELRGGGRLASLTALPQTRED